VFHLKIIAYFQRYFSYTRTLTPRQNKHFTHYTKAQIETQLNCHNLQIVHLLLILLLSMTNVEPHISQRIYRQISGNQLLLNLKS
jgi:hypothetical protein